MIGLYGEVKLPVGAVLPAIDIATFVHSASAGGGVLAKMEKAMTERGTVDRRSDCLTIGGRGRGRGSCANSATFVPQDIAELVLPPILPRSGLRVC